VHCSIWWAPPTPPIQLDQLIHLQGSAQVPSLWTQHIQDHLLSIKKRSLLSDSSSISHIIWELPGHMFPFLLDQNLLVE
jgi:hypothetical protein